MSYTNRTFTWDFDALKRFYERYIVKWLNSAVSWTDEQKTQARANLGFGDGDAIVTTANQISSDLNVADENGNVLAILKDGHIKTKNFDSSVDSFKTEDTDYADLVITDDDSHAIAVFKDGHIRTKKFDSSDFVYAERPESGYENFLVDVNINVEDNDSVTTNKQDDVNMQQDRCLLRLPVNYSATGEPVRLIIAGQSSSGRITSTTTTPQKVVPSYNVLLGEGYAVLQANGTPGYTDGIENYGSSGTPAYLQSIKAAYKYVTDKYNIRKDGVLLCGWSQGSLKAWQLAANKIIPVNAMVLFGFACDLWKLMYAYCPAANREWMCEQFGFVEKEANAYVLDVFSNIYSQGDTVIKPTSYSNAQTVPTDYEFAYILNNCEKWLGYDPICWGTSINIIAEQFRHRNWVTVQDAAEDACFDNVANIVPCPTKVFVGTNDVLTPPKLTNWYKRMAENAGMMLHVRTYQGGTHNYNNQYPTTDFVTKYNGTVTANIPSQEGILFLERYD